MDGERLLEDLAGETELFISALREDRNRAKVLSVLEETDMSRYSLQECNYCLSYVYDEPVKFTAPEQVGEFLADKRKKL